jgi:hypothetical protein
MWKEASRKKRLAGVGGEAPSFGATLQDKTGNVMGKLVTEIYGEIGVMDLGHTTAVWLLSYPRRQRASDSLSQWPR